MIRFTFTYLKPVALFLSMVVLFQCCKVYDKTPVTIEQAINIDHKKVKRIKIDLVGDKKLILDSIYYKKGQLYGLMKVTKKTKVTQEYGQVWTEREKNKIEIEINEDEIIQIRLHNKAKSGTLTFFVAGISAFVVFLAIVMIVWSSTDED